MYLNSPPPILLDVYAIELRQFVDQSGPFPPGLFDPHAEIGHKVLGVAAVLTLSVLDEVLVALPRALVVVCQSLAPRFLWKKDREGSREALLQGWAWDIPQIPPIPQVP